MKVNRWLKQASDNLVKSGIGTARLDSLVLLEDVSGHDRAWLLANPEFDISAVQLTKLEKLLKRRVAHEPLAYIRGRTEFYGHEFLLNRHVLEPRPESEAMIDLLKELIVQADFDTKKLLIADVGTGSGSLGIATKLELPEAQIELLDIDPRALEVAKMNVDKYTPHSRLIKSDLLSNTTTKYDILLCNLPYVPDDFQINLAAGHEPRIAIFGGPDGLDVYRKLFQQLKMRRQKPLYILCESMPPQHLALKNIALGAGYKLIKTRSFIQNFEFKK